MNPLTTQNGEIKKEVPKVGEIPQLSVEMEKRFDGRFGFLNKIVEHFGYNKEVCWGDEVKHFFATVLAEEREKVLKLVKLERDKNEKYSINWDVLEELRQQIKEMK
jgi:hypothetical protein